MDKPTAAEYLCISERTITKLVSGKQIPSRTVGPKLIRFCKEELDEWMRALPTGQTAREKEARRPKTG
ncbi:helix-turn-helix domain-containing protein [Candidatus Laterigemmans baculatus]|uniref:helix-turn-helix domain-containing protein n=1 Tax=Candidatus Laterigemmans baculatus TaxID=2770505 RepID=UPI0013DC86CF